MEFFVRQQFRANVPGKDVDEDPTWYDSRLEALQGALCEASSLAAFVSDELEQDCNKESVPSEDDVRMIREKFLECEKYILEGIAVLGALWEELNI